VCDDPERTLARLKPHIDYQATAYGKFRDETDHAEGRDPAKTPRAGSASHDSYKVLTPEDAISHIRKTTEGLPVAYMLPWLSVGGMPDDLVQRHIELVVTKVAPALAGDGYADKREAQRVS
jgi:hypothetical protein